MHYTDYFSLFNVTEFVQSQTLTLKRFKRQQSLVEKVGYMLVVKGFLLLREGVDILVGRAALPLGKCRSRYSLSYLGVLW